MTAKLATLELEIPKEVIDHAKKEGISIEEFRKSLELFGTMQLVSETSKLDKEGMLSLANRIKGSSWMKVSKRLHL